MESCWDSIPSAMGWEWGGMGWMADFWPHHKKSSQHHHGFRNRCHSIHNPSTKSSPVINPMFLFPPRKQNESQLFHIFVSPPLATLLVRRNGQTTSRSKTHNSTTYGSLQTVRSIRRHDLASKQLVRTTYRAARCLNATELKKTLLY